MARRPPQSSLVGCQFGCHRGLSISTVQMGWMKDGQLSLIQASQGVSPGPSLNRLRPAYRISSLASLDLHSVQQRRVVILGLIHGSGDEQIARVGVSRGPRLDQDRTGD